MNHLNYYVYVWEWILTAVFFLFRSNVTWSLEGPMAQAWNSSVNDFSELEMDIYFVTLVVSLASAILWIVYITYYNSRVLGYILTRLANKFYFQDENFKIGMFTLISSFLCSPRSV